MDYVAEYNRRTPYRPSPASGIPASAPRDIPGAPAGTSASDRPGEGAQGAWKQVDTRRTTAC
jgi:hypothetical protein